jgi:acetyltransferase-like isoleucine patch superfamily enzyme
MWTIVRIKLRKLLEKAEHLILGDGTGLPQRYPRYQIGRDSYGWPRIVDSGEGATLKIGAFCSIAKGVTILLGGEHHTEWVTTFPFPVLWRAARQIRGHPKTKGEIIIGNDVWIAQDALILSGVTIGDGAVIAARAVVTKDIEPYSIVAGNPARVIRKRFPEEAIARLLAVAWWAWTPEEIEKALPLLLSDDIEAFLDYAEHRK